MDGHEVISAYLWVIELGVIFQIFITNIRYFYNQKSYSQVVFLFKVK